MSNFRTKDEASLLLRSRLICLGLLHLPYVKHFLPVARDYIKIGKRFYCVVLADFLICCIPTDWWSDQADLLEKGKAERIKTSPA